MWLSAVPVPALEVFRVHAIGIDIGGTKIAGAVVDDDGIIVDEARVPTPSGQTQLIEDAVVEMVTRLAAGRQIEGVGVAAAGFIDAAQSTVYYAPNINWRNEPFQARLSSRIDLPIVIENDANAAGWAEFRFGAGRLYSDMVMLTIGTGVGGAIVTDDRLFRVVSAPVPSSATFVWFRRVCRVAAASVAASNSTVPVGRSCGWQTNWRMPGASARPSPSAGRRPVSSTGMMWPT